MANWFSSLPGWLTPITGGLLGSGSFTDALFGKTGLFSNPSGAWDNFKNGATNDINYKIAQENLAYQRERNQIEDDRYDEETAYNRAFAEDERDYNRAFAEENQAYNRTWAEEEREYSRALQQQIFEREDTALSRQAAELSNLGINPLSQQMNGLGSGSVVSSSSPQTVSPGDSAQPMLSSRGGTALHNDFVMQDQGILQALSPMLSLADTINGITTGEYQRDSLALENDRKFLENMYFANSIGMDYNASHYTFKGFDNYRNNSISYNDTNSSKPWFDTDEAKEGRWSKIRSDRLNNLPSWSKDVSALSDQGIQNDINKALTKMSKNFDLFMNQFDKSDKLKKINPFNFLQYMFQ